MYIDLGHEERIRAVWADLLHPHRRGLGRLLRGHPLGHQRQPDGGMGNGRRHRETVRIRKSGKEEKNLEM